jgi:hypothetical protein
MTLLDLNVLAEQVIRRAQQQGHVVPREVREELARAGVAEDQWKDVLALAGPALVFRQGRYYYQAPGTARLRQEEAQRREVRRAVRHLMKRHRQEAKEIERRGEERLDYLEPVIVSTEDGRTFRMLSRDLSTSGIRLIGTKRFLGQKVRIHLPAEGTGPAWNFLVRILWTCSVGDELFENGGTFLEVSPTEDGAAQAGG